MSAPLKEILTRLAARWPLEWALPGDRVGLQVGHPDTVVDLILVALEVGEAVIEEARSLKAQLLLTHHPLLYHPVEVLRGDEPLGRLLTEVVKGDLAVASWHTNLDVAPGGVNDYLAQRLELTQVEVLEETGREYWCKLAVFVPGGYEDRVRRALADDRVGVIGDYSHCTFATPGQGTYIPLAGARPFAGTPGVLSRVQEVRLEILVPATRLAAALERLKAAHPYEEPAYDIYPLQNPGLPLGLGRVGQWPEPRPFAGVVAQVKELFGQQTIRLWGPAPEMVQRAAVCGGSGGDLIGQARARGAQVYITGEVRYHQAAPWAPAGPAVLEMGHFASEVVFVPEWARQLRQLFKEAGMALEVRVAREESPKVEYA